MIAETEAGKKSDCGKLCKSWKCIWTFTIWLFGTHGSVFRQGNNMTLLVLRKGHSGGFVEDEVEV